MGEFLEAWPLFQDAILTSILAGAVLGFIGVYIVVRGMVFLSATLAQCASLGVAGAFYLRGFFSHSPTAHAHSISQSFSPLIMAFIFTTVPALFMLIDIRKWRVHRDTLLGFLFLVSTALTLSLGTRIAEEMHDIDSLLHGSAVAVLPEELRFIAFFGLLIITVHLVFRRGFEQTTLDRDDALVRGLPVQFIDVMLMLTVALAIAVFTQVIGALPVFAFGVLPAVAALRIMPNLFLSACLAAFFGSVSGLLGYMLAYLAQLPVGASQCLVAAAITALVLVGASLRSAKKRKASAKKA